MELLSFLDSSVTPWHAADNLARRFSANGFLELREGVPWNLAGNSAYFVQRGAALFAFRTPESWNSESRFLLASAHTDFPSLKVSPHPDSFSCGIHRLHPEVYGGPLLNTWFDRDLGIAGLAVVSHSGVLEKRLVRLKTLCRIPELAIHLERNVNEKGFLPNPQNHLDVCFSVDSRKGFVQILEEECGVTVVDFEMQFFDAAPAAFGGLSGEWIYSGRLDNLTSCDAIASGMIRSDGGSPHLRGAFFFDNEEVGSETRSGAGGNFAPAMLERVAECLRLPRGELWGKLSDSLLLSLDAAHGTHPAYPEKMEPNHSPVLGEGIVLKVNAKKRYASESFSNAALKILCEKAGVELQTFVSRGDMPCGSTVGPRLSAALGIPAADLGEAILSMHSAREMSAVADHLDMCLLMGTFFAGERVRWNS